MNTQHTPGPWRYARGNGSPTTGEHMIAGATPGYLAEVRDVGSGSVVANARLIAAAPELLEALIVITDESVCIKSAVVERARAAIAKARGET